MMLYPAYINGQTVKYAQMHRFLGVNIDRSLLWSPRCAYLTRLTYCACVEIHVRKIIGHLCALHATVVHGLICETTVLQLASVIKRLQDQYPFSGEFVGPNAAYSSRPALMRFSLCKDCACQRPSGHNIHRCRLPQNTHPTHPRHL